MKSEILVIAEAILANTQVLKMLVEKLPAAAQAEVAKAVNATPADTPVATPVVTPVAPVVAPAPTPVVAAPIPVVVETPTPAPAPVVAAPAPVVTPTSTVGAAPFTDQRGLVNYVMDSYKTLGPIKGAEIQMVLNNCGVANINDVKPEMYAPLFAGIEALKAGV